MPADDQNSLRSSCLQVLGFERSITTRRSHVKRPTLSAVAARSPHSYDGSAQSPWGCSSAGRAFDWQSKGRGFESPQLHQPTMRISLRIQGVLAIPRLSGLSRGASRSTDGPVNRGVRTRDREPATKQWSRPFLTKQRDVRPVPAAGATNQAVQLEAKERRVNSVSDVLAALRSLPGDLHPHLAKGKRPPSGSVSSRELAEARSSSELSPLIVGATKLAAAKLDAVKDQIKALSLLQGDLSLKFARAGPARSILEASSSVIWLLGGEGGAQDRAQRFVRLKQGELKEERKLANVHGGLEPEDPRNA